MLQTVSDYIDDFIKKHGELHKGSDDVLYGSIQVAGALRYVTFAHLGNPVRISLAVGELGTDDLDDFIENVNNMDPRNDFSHRILVEEDIVFWIFDLLIPNCSLKELLALWFALAEVEVPMVDAMIEAASNGLTSVGNSVNPPMISTAVH